MAPNFSRLETDQPENSRLLAAMLQAREALARRSWSHPLEHTGEEWWADVLADPRARRQTRDSPSRNPLTAYRLRDEPHSTILVGCSKCDWKAAYSRDELILLYGGARVMPDLLNSTISLRRAAHGSARTGTAVARILSSRSRGGDDHPRNTNGQRQLPGDWTRH
jgi:hypothetical protein